MEKEIYCVCQEVNDKGWQKGDNFFANHEDAVKHMRNYVAHVVYNYMKATYYQELGYKVDSLKVWSDTVIHSPQRLPSQSITFRVFDGENYNYWDVRVFAVSLFDAHAPNDRNL